MPQEFSNCLRNALILFGILQGKLPLSGIAVNRLEDTENIKNSFEVTGPMIERILVICSSRTESLRWVEILRQQIKCARTPSGIPSIPHYPMPPPHVSPPYLLLTFWIRDAIQNGRLDLFTIKMLTKQFPKLETFRPLSPWRWRNFQNNTNEMFVN